MTRTPSGCSWVELVERAMPLEVRELAATLARIEAAGGLVPTSGAIVTLSVSSDARSEGAPA